MAKDTGPVGGHCRQVNQTFVEKFSVWYGTHYTCSKVTGVTFQMSPVQWE